MPNVQGRPPFPAGAHTRPIGSGLRRRSTLRVAMVGASACLALCATVLAATGVLPAAGTATGDPLGVTIASYDGDIVTTTPSESASAGSDVTYEVTVSNPTASTQTNVSVPVDLPANFTLDAGTVAPSTGEAPLSADVLGWTVPSLGAGASATLTYTEATDVPDVLESDATSASATSDQSTTASTVSASVEVIPASDLTISVTDGTDTITPGASDTYTITLTNHGPSEAPDATVTDIASGGFTEVSEADSLGSSYTDLGGGQFQWTGIDLTAGSSETIVLTGTAPSTLTTGAAYVNLANVSLYPGEIDTGPASNAVDTDVVGGTAAGDPLGVTIASYDGDTVTTTPSESASAGSDVTYEVTVSNPTASTQTNVSVPVDLPANFTLDAGTVAPSTGRPRSVRTSSAGRCRVWGRAPRPRSPTPRQPTFPTCSSPTPPRHRRRATRAPRRAPCRPRSRSSRRRTSPSASPTAPTPSPPARRTPTPSRSPTTGRRPPRTRRLPTP